MRFIVEIESENLKKREKRVRERYKEIDRKI